MTTTLDPRLQALALHAAQTVLHTSTDPATAIVAMDPSTGAVKAMVDYLPSGRHLEFNLATQAHRSTGSAFKPITLATALDEGASLYSTFHGPPEIYITDPQCQTNNGPWDVHNSGDESAGTTNLIGATAGSINTIYAQLVAKTGDPASHADGALDGGHEQRAADFPPVCAITLGSVGFTPLELTDVYATIAAGGIHHAPQAFETVRGPNAQGARQDLHVRPRGARPEPRRRAHVRAGAGDPVRHRHRGVHRPRRPPARPAPRRTTRTRGSAASSRSS